MDYQQHIIQSKMIQKSTVMLNCVECKQDFGDWAKLKIKKDSKCFPCFKNFKKKFKRVELNFLSDSESESDSV